MTREEAIAFLQGRIDLIDKYYPQIEDYREALDMAIKALEQEPSSSENPNRWIPCSERLPKQNEYVGDVCKYYLIQDEFGDMHVATYTNIGWIPINTICALGDEVIAWMPLPQPYKAEREDKE